MALSYNPRIVMDGLVLYLDAANTKSYDYKENLLTYTNSIGDANYANGGCTIVLNAAVAPNGTVTATSIDQGASVNNYVYGGAPQSLTANTVYTYSIHIKQNNTTSYTTTIDENGFGGKRYQMTFTYATETLTSGVTGATNDGAVLGTSYTKLQNGWYRISITFRTSTTSVSSFIDMITRFAGPGLHYVWGRQLEKNSSMNVYTANTTAVTNKGTSWYDLTSNGNAATLTNGPLFNPDNKGSMIFDGANDYIDCGSNSNFSSPLITASIIVKCSTFSTRPHLFGLGGGSSGNFYMVVETSGTFRFFNDIGAGWAVAANTTAFPLNTWTHVTCTHDGAISRIYYNGVQQSESARVGTLRNWTSDSLQIGGISNGTQLLTGNVAVAQLYNRALPATEIKQNFNSLRGRYGI